MEIPFACGALAGAATVSIGLCRLATHFPRVAEEINRRYDNILADQRARESSWTGRTDIPTLGVINMLATLGIGFLFGHPPARK